MQTITYEMALRAMNEAVKAKGPDYVYDRTDHGGYCYNVWQGGPACLIGHALVWLGVPVEWFVEGREKNNALSVCQLLESTDMLLVEDDARDLFTRAQIRQDEGSNWGESVASAHLGEDSLEFLRIGRV